METFAKRILTAVAAVLLLVYIGYHIFMANYSPVKVESAQRFEEYETIDTDGLVVRKEAIIPRQNANAFVYYNAQNGSRVAKNGRIADLYESQEQAADHKEILRLEEEIAEMQAIQEQGQNNRVNLDIITKQLGKAQAEVIAAMSAPRVNHIDALSDQLLTLMNKQQITIGQDIDYTSRIAELQSRLTTLKSKAVAPIGAVMSPTAGFFVNSVDGFETLMDAESILSVTTDQIRSVMAQEPTVPQGQYIGKVVGSYEWYLVCVLPAEKMTQVSLDRSIDLRLPYVSSDPIPVTVVATNRDREGNMAVVFRCDYMSADLSDIRRETVQILVRHHEGLRVPDDAIRFNEQQEPGVFVQEGNVIVFKRIQVAYHSEKGSYSICEINDTDKSYLQVFDDIVTEGKDLYDGKIV